jgi:hypothetical protein
VPVIRESPINIERNKDNRHVDTANAIVIDGSSRRSLTVYFNHVDSGQGYGCIIEHGVTSGPVRTWKKPSRTMRYKYFRGCPKKYLSLVKEFEKALHS